MGKKMKLLTRVQARINSIHRDEEGATAVEYGLIVSLIAVFIIGAVGLVGINLEAIFQAVAAAL
jgi:pilus assembly protein Flp/PilA